MPSSVSADDFLTISPRIRVLPVIHGSGDFAIRVREELLARPYECVALPLPPSFQDDVEAAVERLPSISAVVQETDDEGFTYVPIDPCQGVIAAIRTAIGERIARAFIDLESPRFESLSGVFPDPYALKRSRTEVFAAALLPAIAPPQTELQTDRVLWMAHRLRELERKHSRILLVCSLLDWPWIRDAYQRRLDPPPEPEPRYAPVRTFGVDPSTLLFFLGELPFVTALYERGRIELTDDDNLSVDGVKEMVLAARDRLKTELPRVARRISPQVLRIYFQYVRNLALMGRRLTPDLHALVTAAKQTAGDDFALSVAETAREYAYARPDPDDAIPLLRMSIDRAELPGEGVVPMLSRLPGQAVHWRACELRPRPPEPERKRWRQQWDPYGMCSWPPEDSRIESFQHHVRDQARALLGSDLSRSEKFSTSLKDGLDIRETLRHWHTGDLYVKVIPPSRGAVEVVVFLFDSPADPRRYVNRATWFAEHSEESTLAFYSTDPMQDLIGPGIARAEYGGAFFLFPPRFIPDIWTDPRLDFADTLEDRLLSGALFHSRERHVALVSPRPPSASWRRLARRFGKSFIHLPLSRFSPPLLERLRHFHILNGKSVRSYAADYIRDM
jgi:hypothetical protein